MYVLCVVALHEEDSDGGWVACDSCFHWYHIACAGIPQDLHDVDSLDLSQKQEPSFPGLLLHLSSFYSFSLCLLGFMSSLYAPATPPSKGLYPKCFPSHGRDHTTCCTCWNKRSNLGLGVRMHRIYVLLFSPTENSRTKNPDSSKCVVAYLAIHVDAQIQNSLQIIYRTFMVCMKTPDRIEGTRVFSQKEQDDTWGNHSTNLSLYRGKKVIKACVHVCVCMCVCLSCGVVGWWAGGLLNLPEYIIHNRILTTIFIQYLFKLWHTIVLECEWELSYRKAAAQYGIPRSTLHDHVTGKATSLKRGPLTVLTAAEQMLVDWALHMGYGWFVTPRCLTLQGNKKTSSPIDALST